MARRTAAAGLCLALVLGLTACSARDALCDTTGVGCAAKGADQALDIIIDPTGSQRTRLLRALQLDQLTAAINAAGRNEHVLVNVYALGARKTDTRTIITDAAIDPMDNTPQGRQTLATTRVQIRALAEAALRRPAPRNSDIWGAIAFAAEQHALRGNHLPHKIVVLGDGVQVVPGANWHESVPTPPVAARTILALYPSLQLMNTTVAIATGRTSDHLERPPGYITRLTAAHQAVCDALATTCTLATTIR